MPVETPPTPDTTPPPPRLDYAQAQSIVSRMGLRRVIGLSVLVALVVAALVWWDPAVRRVQRWRSERAYRQLQQTCMTYAAPANRVVYEEDPADAAALQKRDSAYAPILQLDRATMTQIIRPGWQPPVQFTEPLWTKYSVGIRRLPTTPRAVAFMGERRTKSGERRLVCVGIAIQAQQLADGRWSIVRWLQAWSFAPSSLDSADQTAPMGLMVIDSDAKRPPGGSDPLTDDPDHPFTPPFPLRLYAGQPDPADASRFTIGYALQGRRGTISGVLQDDGSVLLTPDIGWHGRLGTTVSWIPRLPSAATVPSPSH